MIINAKGFPFKFPAGETQVRVVSNSIEETIFKKIRTADDVMEILLTVDALRRQGVHSIKLVMPYVPYSRQDRVMVYGESLGIKVFADLINSCKFYEVEIWDPHSDVTTALIDNVKVIGQSELMARTLYPEHDTHIGPKLYKMSLVCPDAGARKKILECQKSIKAREIIYADKVRDASTGQITGTTINWGNFDFRDGSELLIVDDICEGGRTFIEIAKAMETSMTGINYKLHLHVTHGFFSKGLDELSEYFDGVTCANLMSQDPAVILHPTLKGNKSL